MLFVTTRNYTVSSFGGGTGSVIPMYLSLSFSLLMGFFSTYREGIQCTL